jgi:hypothetical protein
MQSEIEQRHGYYAQKNERSSNISNDTLRVLELDNSMRLLERARLTNR